MTPLLKKRSIEFLVKHKLRDESQHGFLKGRSCLSNLLCFQKTYVFRIHLMIKCPIKDRLKLDTSMVDRQKTEDNSRGGDINPKTSCEWSVMGVSIGTYIIFEIYK